MELLINEGLVWSVEIPRSRENSVMNPHAPSTWFLRLWALGPSCFIDCVLLFNLWGLPSGATAGGASWKREEDSADLGMVKLNIFPAGRV